jgi:HTH-type transcriptional regulator / antitoxin MqsA
MDDKLTRVCHECGHPMIEAARPMTITYKRLSSTFDMPGLYCTNCDESLHSGADMRVSDRELNLLKAQADDLLLPDAIRQIRKQLKLTQEAAGNLLGGGPNAFNKYERSLLLPSKSTSNLLRVLSQHPEALNALRDAKSRPPEDRDEAAATVLRQSERLTQPQKIKTSRSKQSSKDKMLA